MADLSTKYLGLTIRNPIVVGSSGLTNSVEDIVKLEQNGAGAIVLKSIFEEQIMLEAEWRMKKAEEDIQEKKSRWLADQEELELERQIALKKLVSMRAANAQLRAEKQAALEQVKKSEHTTKLHIAKQMLQAGSEQSLIIQVTGLSESELTGL